MKLSGARLLIFFAIATGGAIASARAAFAEQGILDRLIGSTCAVSQFDGLVAGGGAQKNFLVLADCGNQTMRMLLIHGRFPIAPSAKRDDFGIMDKIDLPVPLGASANLANGVCFLDGHAVGGTIGVIADWGKRERISLGNGLIAIIVPSHDRRKLELLHDTRIYCRKDEP